MRQQPKHTVETRTSTPNRNYSNAIFAIPTAETRSSTPKRNYKQWYWSKQKSVCFTHYFGHYTFHRWAGSAAISGMESSAETNFFHCANLPYKTQTKKKKHPKRGLRSQHAIDQRKANRTKRRRESRILYRTYWQHVQKARSGKARPAGLSQLAREPSKHPNLIPSPPSPVAIDLAISIITKSDTNKLRITVLKNTKENNTPVQFHGSKAPRCRSELSTAAG